MESSTNEVEGQEVQARLYAILDKLTNMAQALPSKYQQRLSMDLLSALANNLLNETIFEIVKGLKEMQDISEKQMYQNRLKLVEKQRMERHKVRERKLKPKVLEKELQALAQKHKTDLRQYDTSLVMVMDQKVSEQQIMMEKAGIPGFYLTNDPTEIKIQMYIFEFITKLSVWSVLEDFPKSSSSSTSSSKCENNVTRISRTRPYQ